MSDQCLSLVNSCEYLMAQWNYVYGESALPSSMGPGVNSGLVSFNKLTSVFYASVLLLIMNFVVTLSNLLRIHSSMASWIQRYFNNVMTKFIVNNRTDTLKTDINLLFFYDDILLNCPLSLADASHEFQIHVSVRILTIKISQ